MSNDQDPKIARVTMADIVEGLRAQRDALVKLSMCLQDYRFEQECARESRAGEEAQTCVDNARGRASPPPRQA